MSSPTIGHVVSFNQSTTISHIVRSVILRRSAMSSPTINHVVSFNQSTTISQVIADDQPCLLFQSINDDLPYRPSLSFSDDQPCLRRRSAMSSLSINP
ncbi:hypothetical protein RHMOL_Rhmol01G0151100 [Rhododendron molle]|uniref:Uncharacterized protein n=1 Tax=Rhododendron molle TaxID=49168 RepID=A0ACC0Q1Z3_RHOML|nr:hypothetical protein RHMOL_Rhmol01G0151100 [Rhododendron molle]